MARTTFLVSVSLFASAVLAHTVEYNLKISNGPITPDGVERKSATLVNGGYPGPLIKATKGDTLKINVLNKLSDPSTLLATSIHWHGLHEHRNADDDGPAFVTQCPIIPDTSYTYTIPLGKQTGLIGTTGIWAHTIEASGIIALQQPDSATINGKGRYDPNTMPANPDTLYTLKVKRGKRYRLRVINTSAIASFLFGIQGHKCTVIASDGMPTEPYTVDQFNILAAQRRDCVFTADQAPGTYWINAPLTNVANKTTQALLIYEDDSRPYQPPKGPYSSCSVSEDVMKYWRHRHDHGSMIEHGGHRARSGGIGIGHQVAKRQTNATQVVLDETKLAPLKDKVPCNPNEPADMTLDLAFGLGQAAGTWAINNITYRSPYDPALLTILKDKDGVTESDFSPTAHTVILPKNKCIEFDLKGTSGIPITHPVHLHGHTFSVVQYGNSTLNYINPPQGDVVGTPDSGVRLRFKTDNPGPWFLHCHIDRHLVEGFAMVFAEAPEATKKGSQSVQPDSQWKNLCKAYDAWFKDQPTNQNPDL
ncbi:laccase-1 [Rhizoctonia solani]|nr:laccase-1 [Rhizoctonia solani]